MHMLKSNFIILIITFIILQVSYVVAEEKFLSLKKIKLMSDMVQVLTLL
jgi:hypothetical protein